MFLKHLWNFKISCFQRFGRFDGAPSMGVADVATSDSTIKVVHRMSKFNIFYYFLFIALSPACSCRLLLLSLLQENAVDYCSHSYRLLLSLLQAIAVDYCSHSCRQIATKYCFLSCRQLQNVIVLTFSMFLCILAACYCSDSCSDSSMF